MTNNFINLPLKLLWALRLIYLVYTNINQIQVEYYIIILFTNARNKGNGINFRDMEEIQFEVYLKLLGRCLLFILLFKVLVLLRLSQSTIISNL